MLDEGIVMQRQPNIIGGADNDACAAPTVSGF